MLDPRLVEDVAQRLEADPGLTEKDWHVVRAIDVVAAADHGPATPVFSGDTSLSKGWGLIRRFSEDIDFKVAMPELPSDSARKRGRSRYRHLIVDALTAGGFTLIGDVRRGGETNRFFSANLAYPSAFSMAVGFRPHIVVEMTFEATALLPTLQPIRSLIATAQQTAPEVAAFACVDPAETAADKLSALAWRVCARDRGSFRDDPRIVRHVHDLAALEPRVAASPHFADLVHKAVAIDATRGDGRVPADPDARFAMMLDRLRTDPGWASEYATFVRDHSYAGPGEVLSFAEAMAACERLIQTL